MRILFIEDDRQLAETLKQALEPVYSVDIALTGREGLVRAEDETFDAILLDLNLPDISGDEVCTALRRHGVTHPILVLSGRDAVCDKVALLNMGADDFITKPCHLAEIRARLRRALQRSMPLPRLVLGDLELDRAARSVRYRGQQILLRRKEFELLECLMQHKGRVVTRDMATDYISGDGHQPWTNVVDVHIKRLRDKIDRPFGISLIKTVHGVGYKIDDNAVAERRVGYERVTQ